LAKKLDVSEAEANRMVNAVRDGMIEEIVENGSLKLSGLGKFQVKDRAARNGVNPQTQEPILIPATKVVRFSAFTKLKNAVKA